MYRYNISTLLHFYFFLCFRALEKPSLKNQNWLKIRNLLCNSRRIENDKFHRWRKPTMNLEKCGIKEDVRNKVKITEMKNFAEQKQRRTIKGVPIIKKKRARQWRNTNKKVKVPFIPLPGCRVPFNIYLTRLHLTYNTYST